MKHKIADLEGALLDAAVAKALGYEWRVDDETVVYARRWGPARDEEAFCPSMYWDHGGPIIARERIGVEPYKEDSVGHWLARIPGSRGGDGPTPLVAAMRAYVSSRFGDEVELP